MHAAVANTAEVGYRAFETVIGHRFVRPDLLTEALTHRSALQGKRRGPRPSSNERLEFLGDRVLNLLMAEWLLEAFPSENEGDLGRRQAHLVSGSTVALVAEQIGLAGALQLSPGEARVGVATLATVRSDAMEAVLGAVFLDGGLDAARAIVRRAWAREFDGQGLPPRDSKTALQEWALARALPLPTYVVVESTGPSHAPQFTVRVTVAGTTGNGTASSKQAAQRLAAADVLAQVGKA